MRFTREGWAEKKDSDCPGENFRKIADSLSVFMVFTVWSPSGDSGQATSTSARSFARMSFRHHRMKQLAVYWPNIDSDILDLCWQCPICSGHQSEQLDAT